MDKPANQNIEVHLFQTRNPLEWKARIDCGTERFYIGPANITSILSNIMNFVRVEAAYADLKVHGEVATPTARPMTMREARERRTRIAESEDDGS